MTEEENIQIINTLCWEVSLLLSPAVQYVTVMLAELTKTQFPFGSQSLRLWEVYTLVSRI